ncbi:MAG: hypothetical protein AAFX81_17660 [Pseudomonadota bacterium]
MADVRLLVEVVPTATGEAQLHALTAGLARRLGSDGAFRVDEATRAAPDQSRGLEVAEIGRVLVEWGQAYGPELAAGAAGALGAQVVDGLVAAVRVWMGDAGPTVDKVIIEADDGVTLEITTNGADPKQVAQAAAAYAERLKATD